MTATQLLLVRHGTTDANVRVPYTLQGSTIDLPLNDNGRQQAQQVAEFLASFPIKHVYSSPLQRAHETARSMIVCAVPPGAQIEMLGIAHHLKRNFPVPVVSECASNLVQRFNNGTLVTNTMPPALLYSPVTDAAAVVAESELPQALKGRFRCVAVCTNYGNTEVFFESDPYIGIVCPRAEFGKTVFYYKLADGVYAYHYQRP